jgi:hypothetical protein
MTAEQCKESMKRSAELMRDQIRPRKPMLELPPGWKDVTEQMNDRTFVLIGAPVRRKD